MKKIAYNHSVGGDKLFNLCVGTDTHVHSIGEHDSAVKIKIHRNQSIQDESTNHNNYYVFIITMIYKDISYKRFYNQLNFD